MSACSSGGSSYRSLSTGAGGSIRFLMPSMPAMQHGRERQVRVADGSGTRNSMRLAFGFDPVTGMRTQAERLRAE